MAASLHDRLMTDLQALVKSLGLAGDPAAGVADVGDQVYVEEQAANATYPAVMLTARGLEEEGPNELSNSEQVGITYPVALLVCDEPRPTIKDVAPVYKDWRRRLREALHEQTNAAGAAAGQFLPDCPECACTTVRFLDVHGEKAAQALQGYENVVTALLVECHCAEAR